MSGSHTGIKYWEWAGLLPPPTHDMNLRLRVWLQGGAHQKVSERLLSLFAVLNLICDRWIFFQFETMSAVTSQPLPFDRLEREKHIQAIFRAFKNRCGPTCQCQLPSPRLTSPNQTSPPDWESEAQSSLAPPEATNSSQVEKRWPAAGTHFLSTLQTADKIKITARPEVQGEPELLCLFTDFYSLKGEICHCRTTVCSPEDLQHCNRRKQTTVICGCRRYSLLLSCITFH